MTRKCVVQSEGQCVCGAVSFEIDVPAVWAGHDHGEASRRALGCAYANHVGTWKSRFRWLAGEEDLTRYEDEVNRTTRSFCRRCGTPVAYVKARAPRCINIPRSLFPERTGREPRNHMNLTERADWTYWGEALSPLKGYPGVMRERPRKKRLDPVGAE